MKTLFKFTAWLAGVTLFLLLTAHFTLRHALNTPKFKTALTGFIERTTGRAADYERLDYSLAPFSLVARKATLKERDGAQDFVSIQTFSARLDFRAKEITVLRLEQPTVRIRQRPDGSYNFSDLWFGRPSAMEAGAVKEPASLPDAGASDPGEQAAPGPEQRETAAPRFSLRMLQIHDARIEFIRDPARGTLDRFTLTNLNFLLRDLAPDKPVRLNGSAAIGKSSGVQFELSGPALSDYAGNLGAWPLGLGGRLDIRDSADVQALLPEGVPPFRDLWITWNAQGALSDKLIILVNGKSAEPTESHPLAVQAGLQAEFHLPAPMVQHLLAGNPLPADLQFELPPCEPPPGTMSFTARPLAALLLKHLQATAEITIPVAVHGRNRLEQGTATLYLRDGVLIMPRASGSVHGGVIEARGNVRLLNCPVSYRLDRLLAKDIVLEQMLAANGLDDFANLAGVLQLEASATGQAFSPSGWLAGEADLRGHIDRLRSIGPGGSLMDQVWRQLDNPLLLRLVPRLKPKVEQARQAVDNVTTSEYDEAAAELALRGGIVTLSEGRLAMPGYRLDASGTIRPAEQQLELTARLLASPEETARLTDGKDLSVYLPYENGGLAIPLAIRGSLQDPEVWPDLNRLLQNALAGDGLGQVLETLSDSDSQRVQKGLRRLQDWGLIPPNP